jgi:hypothetical protein
MQVVANAHRQREFEESQNLLRGAVARYQSLSRRNLIVGKKRRPVVSIDVLAEARRNLQGVLLGARAKLHPDDYEAFQSYYYSSIDPLHLGRRGGLFDNLLGPITSGEVSLENELRWIVLRFRFEKALVDQHVQNSLAIDRELLKGEPEEALSILNAAVEELGHSIWSVQMKLALEQVVGGLEAQKAFFLEIRNKHRAGPLPYVAYQTSVRNEDRTTLHRYQEELRPRLAAMKPAALGKYLLVKLLGEWPSGRRPLAQVLRVEQGRSIIDLYETFVALAQESIRRDDLEWLRGVIADHLRLVQIEDPRLEKLRIRLGLQTRFDLKERDTCTGDALLAGRLAPAARCGRRSRREGDVWGLIYESLALAHRSGRPRRLKSSVGGLLAQVLSRSGDMTLVLGELQKAAFNLSGADLSPKFPPVLRRVLGLMFGPMRPVFPVPVGRRTRWA